ncbi:unnamed protein product [Chrysodeixis includens]|uniref:Uncharacterized protein n=1 Tax=Chrysodeixis includens TaxID=689277 RepID=A0A9N8Q282_CHRIL|nr:unnamed protein product [Chrysodeixis includens]
MGVLDFYWLKLLQCFSVPFCRGYGNAFANYRKPEGPFFNRSFIHVESVFPSFIKKPSLPLSSTVNFSKTTAVDHLRWLKKSKWSCSTPCSGTDQVVNEGLRALSAFSLNFITSS